MKEFTFLEVFNSVREGIYAVHGDGKRLLPNTHISFLDAQTAVLKAFKQARTDRSEEWEETRLRANLKTYPLSSVVLVMDALASQMISPNSRIRNTASRGGINSRVIMVAEDLLGNGNGDRR